jgi:hypothetical protein
VGLEPAQIRKEGDVAGSEVEVSSQESIEACCDGWEIDSIPIGSY